MEAPFFGSHLVFAELPIWAITVILFTLILGIIHVLRDVFEGMPYQVAYSAQFGDAALIAGFLIAATILQRGIELPWHYRCIPFHLLAVSLGLALGVAWWYRDRPRYWGDRYHHLVVAPLICYLSITLLPVILLHGTMIEVLSVLGFVLSWATLIAFDLKQQRMNQREWLQNRGIAWKRGELI